MDIGPKLTNDNLVFGHDTGYTAEGVNLSSRFYKGPPHTNLVEEIDPSYAATNTTNFFNNGGATEEVDIPQVGKRNVQYVEYFNNRYAADGSVNSGTTCCPNLFHYHADGSPYIPVDSSSNYTYSIIYKHSHDYHSANFMYHYQKNSSNNTLTEGGVSSTSTTRRTHLGDGWYHAWGSITTQSTCTNVLLYSFLYNYGTVKHKYYVAAISFVKNTTGETYMKIPPHLMLEPLASVSNTASLIDLKRTKTLDVTNISRGEFAQPDYDGTDDYIQLGNDDWIRLGTNFTIEAVVKPEEDKWMYHFWKGYGSNNSLALGRHSSNDKWMFASMTGGSYVYLYTGTATLNEYCHLVYTYDGSNVRIYQNGVLQTTSAQTHDMLTSSSSAGIGGPNRYWNGKIPVTKIYDRVLTTGEVVSNFKAYKNRFNI